jgi:hypothetical protein
MNVLIVVSLSGRAVKGIEVFTAVEGMEKEVLLRG